MGGGRAEGSSAIGDGGQASVSFMHDIDGRHICIFESSQLEGSYVGDLLYTHCKIFKNRKLYTPIPSAPHILDLKKGKLELISLFSDFF